MKKLIWYEKGRNVSSSSCDVSMKICNGKAGQTISFVFRNNIEELFCTTGHIRFAVDNGLLYFSECDTSRGYRVKSRCVDGKVAPNKYCTCSNKYLCKQIENCSGNYILKYDKEQELYYIKLVYSED